jgi:hypothetical protein
MSFRATASEQETLIEMARFSESKPLGWQNGQTYWRLKKD